MANLIHKTKKERHTIAYAKYLMCVNLKRILSKEEQVDHIDGNKTNDNIENLQILSSIENIRKMVIETGKSAKMYEFICPICKATFKRDVRNSQWKVRLGKQIYCGRVCSGKSSHIK